MEEQNIIPHYYIAALIEKLHKVGVKSFATGFNQMACRKFQGILLIEVEDYENVTDDELKILPR